MNKSRAIKFQELLQKKPSMGEILMSKDKREVPVYVERRDNGNLMVFTNALIDYDCTGWYLTDEDTTKALKILILPESQNKLIALNDGRLDDLFVAALRVVKPNGKGTALICELVDEEHPEIYDERDIDPRGDT